MRVLVLYCHPLDDSFNAAVHRAAVEALRAAGHEVDDCDLYAEDFDPVLRGDERLRYHDLAHNREGVEPYVQRLLQAQALVLVFPVWSFGLPAMLKGWFDRVLVPGVSFHLDAGGRIRPGLTHPRHIVGIATYGTPRWKAWLMGDPPRAAVKRFLKLLSAGRARADYLACYHMNVASATRRERFLREVQAGMRELVVG
jgi:putative NADPH-quinone reductase